MSGPGPAHHMRWSLALPGVPLVGPTRPIGEAIGMGGWSLPDTQGPVTGPIWRQARSLPAT
jgi:hypothetical protein